MHYLLRKTRRRISIREHLPIPRSIFQDKDTQSPVKWNKILIFQFHKTKKKSTIAKALRVELV